LKNADGTPNTDANANPNGMTNENTNDTSSVQLPIPVTPEDTVNVAELARARRIEKASEEFYRVNRERLLRGFDEKDKDTPFAVREFPKRYVSLSGQIKTFIPIALASPVLFNPANVRIDIEGTPNPSTTKPDTKTPAKLETKPEPKLDTKNNSKTRNKEDSKPLVKKFFLMEQFRIDRLAPPTTATTQVASRSPSKIAPKAAPKLPSLQHFGIFFDKPIPIGRYTLRLIHSEKGKPDTAFCEWRVVESPFTASSIKSMRTAKFYYGKPLSLRAKLSPELQDFYASGTENFRIRYQFGVENPHTTRFSPNIWQGPNIPAFAKKMSMEILWVDTVSNYSTALFSRDVTPEQTPPDVLCDNASAESDDAEVLKKTPTSKKAVVPKNFQITIKGVAVDYEVPIDADNKDAKTSRSVRATPSDIEVDAPAAIDFTSPDTKLTIFNGEEPDPKAAWNATATNFSIIKGDFDPKTGTFPITIQVSNLPPKPPAETRSLRGTITFKTDVKIVNRIAGVSAKSNSAPCVVTVNIPYR
jgi:hypothetical protein